jgi:hypothetical protein
MVLHPRPGYGKTAEIGRDFVGPKTGSRRVIRATKRPEKSPKRVPYAPKFPGNHVKCPLLRVRGCPGTRRENRPGSKNRPGPYAIAHENGPKQLFPRKPGVAASPCPEERNGRWPIGMVLHPRPRYGKTAEIGRDFVGPKTGSRRVIRATKRPEKAPKRVPYAPKLPGKHVKHLLFRVRECPEMRRENRPGSKNRLGACAIAHENGPKQQFPRKPGVAAPPCPEEQHGRFPKGMVLCPHPSNCKIAEIGRDFVARNPARDG